MRHRSNRPDRAEPFNQRGHFGGTAKSQSTRHFVMENASTPRQSSQEWVSRNAGALPFGFLANSDPDQPDRCRDNSVT